MSFVAGSTVNSFQCDGLISLLDSFNETPPTFLLRSNSVGKKCPILLRGEISKLWLSYFLVCC